MSTYLEKSLGLKEMMAIAQLSPEELKENYIKIQNDFIALKKYTREQEDRINKLQTKLSKLKSDQNKANGVGSRYVSQRSASMEEKIESLENSIAQLQNKNTNLEGKLKVASIQLKSASRTKFPAAYDHVTSRVDSGLKHPPRRSNSLTNISRQGESPFPVNRAKVLKAKEPLDNLRHFTSSDNSRPQSSPENLSNRPQEFYSEFQSNSRTILEEAKSRILDLEYDRNQLLHQLTLTQQHSETLETELRNQIQDLENLLERERISRRDRNAAQEKEMKDLIRCERQSSEVNARATVLHSQIESMEMRLDTEKAQREQLIEALKLLKLEKCDLQNSNKELQLTNDKMLDKGNESKIAIDHLKKQVRQLEKELETYTKTTFNEIPKTTDVVLHLKKEVSLLQEIIQNEKSEKFLLLKEVVEYKESMKKLNVENRILIASNCEIKESFNRITKNGVYDAADIDKLIHSYKEKSTEANKMNGFDKVAFVELEMKYNELQWLYREKKLELEKQSSLLNGHSDTYRLIQQEKDEVERNLETRYRNLEIQLEKLRGQIKEKDEICSLLDTQLKSLTSEKAKKELLETAIVNRTLFESLSFTVNYNLMEIYVDKITFLITNFDHQKTFVSWLVPFAIKDPLHYTCLAIGQEAFYRQTTLYKFKMNFQNFDALRKGVLKMCVYILASDKNPIKMGECYLPLEELLKHPNNQLHGTLPVAAVFDQDESLPQVIASLVAGSNIGTLHFRIRLLKSSEEEISKFMASCNTRMPQTFSAHDKSESPVVSPKIVNKNISASYVNNDIASSTSDINDEIRTTSDETSPSGSVITCTRKSSPLQSVSESSSKISPAVSPSPLIHSYEETPPETEELSRRSSIETKNVTKPSPPNAPEEPSFLRRKSSIFSKKIIKKVFKLKRSKANIEDSSSPTKPKKRSSPSIKSLSEHSSTDADDVSESKDSDTYFEESSEEEDSMGDSLNRQEVSLSPKRMVQRSTSSEETDSSENSNATPEAKKKGFEEIFVLEIVGIRLTDSEVTSDPSIQLLFVDYHGFLGLPSSELETPQSLPKDRPGKLMIFNFIKEIPLIGERKREFDSLISTNGSIKFTVTSDPLEDEQNEECKDLGYAIVPIKRLLEDPNEVVEFEAFDKKNSIIATLLLKAKMICN